MNCSAPNKTGRVIWLTGLSGSGKTTISKVLVGELRRNGIDPIVLDGDALRAVLGNDFGHTRDDRYKLAFCYARMCKLLADQGATVVCATVSLFHDVQDWNRENLPGYLEIYLRVPIDALIARDPKGLYARARRGELQHVVGIDTPFEAPRAPDVVVDTAANMTPEAACAEILRAGDLDTADTSP